MNIRAFVVTALVLCFFTVICSCRPNNGYYDDGGYYDGGRRGRGYHDDAKYEHDYYKDGGGKREHRGRKGRGGRGKQQRHYKEAPKEQYYDEPHYEAQKPQQHAPVPVKKPAPQPPVVPKKDVPAQPLYPKKPPVYAPPPQYVAPAPPKYNAGPNVGVKFGAAVAPEFAYQRDGSINFATGRNFNRNKGLETNKGGVATNVNAGADANGYVRYRVGVRTEKGPFGTFQIVPDIQLNKGLNTRVGVGVGGAIKTPYGTTAVGGGNTVNVGVKVI